VNQPAYFLILRAVQLLFGFIVFCIGAAFIHDAVTDELVFALVCVSERVCQRYLNEANSIQGAFHLVCGQFQHRSESSHVTSKAAHYSNLNRSGCYPRNFLAYFNGIECTSPLNSHQPSVL
jgi:hypothetical protein